MSLTDFLHALGECCRCSVDAVPPMSLGKPTKAANTEVQVTAQLDLLPPNAGRQLQVSLIQKASCFFLSMGRQSHIARRSIRSKEVCVNCENKSAQV